MQTAIELAEEMEETKTPGLIVLPGGCFFTNSMDILGSVLKKALDTHPELIPVFSAACAAAKGRMN